MSLLWVLELTTLFVPKIIRFTLLSGIKLAKELTTDDLFYRNDVKLSNLNEEILLGTLLGDSCFTKDKTEGSNYRVSCTHSEKQFNYLLYKQKLLRNILNSDKVNEGKSGYDVDSKIYTFHTKAFSELTTFIKKYCMKEDKKYVTERWANNLTPLSLAIWYMDDGTMTASENSIYIRIATNAYSLEEQNNLINALYNKYNIHTNVHLDKRTNTFFLSMCSQEAYKFCKLVAPFMIDSMHYKLPKELQTIKKHKVTTSDNISYGLVESKIIKIKSARCNAVYNIQVENNENYFANGVLTHNCRIQVCAEDVLPVYMKSEQDKWYASIKLDGTSCTAGLFEDAFLIGGRNQWYVGPNFYTETVNKYGNLEEKCKEYLEKYGEYIVFQGELCGPGIQGNKLGLKEKEWLIFNVWASKTGLYDSYVKVDLAPMIEICKDFGLKHVPIVEEKNKFNFKKTDDINTTVKNLLEYTDSFKYRNYFEDASPNQIAEGIVFRKSDMSNSFKVISNKFLLKGGE